MSLSITYTNSHGSHTQPGSLLKGIVHFTSSKDESIAKVTITFSGRCKVKIREHLHYTTRTFRSRGYYFHLTKELFDGGGFTHKAGNYAWPFEFQVPEVAAPQWEVDAPAPKGVKGRRVLDHNGIMQVIPPEDESGKYDNFPPKAPWRASKDLRPHVLPDSFKVEDEKNRVVWEGRVEYALIAKAERPTGGSKIFSLGRGGDLETVVDVPMRHIVDDVGTEMLERRREVHSEGWFPREDKKGKGIGKALSQLSRRNTETEEKLPPLGPWMRLTVETATAVQSHSTMPFVIKATATVPTLSMPSSCEVWASEYAPSQLMPTENRRRSPDHAGMAVMSITELTVSLQRRTSVRDDSMAATEHTAVKLDKDVLCLRREQQGRDVVVAPMLITSCEGDISKRGGTITMQGQIDLENLIRVPALTPSFSTYNIAVEYTLEYEIKAHLFSSTVTLNSADSEGGDPRILVVPASSEVTGEDKGEGAPSSSLRSTEKKEQPGSQAGKVPSKEAEAAMERTERQDPEHEADDELPAYRP